MKTIIAASVIAIALSSCANRGLVQVNSNDMQNKMRDIDKTDYAKVENKHKEKVEHGRQAKYHALANETDKKLNHQKNEDLNKKKTSWDSSFGFY